ncbi:MAG: coproporphyrinogen dehydrogenase, partial [Variovorax paradoxus]
MTQPCTASTGLPDAAPLSAAVLRQFDVAGPRYTSYPTADRFIEAFGADEYAAALRERRDAGASAPPLSLYVHIPFCESLCYYCACNKVVTRHHERATQYLAYLARETRLQAAQLGRRAAVSQLHLGGGTPTFLSDAELGELLAMLRESFDFIPGGEWSTEIDPRTVDAARLASLAALGFNRLSFGVQDFDPEVQKAVHRIQPAHQVFGLMADARALGFKSINADLIYGLPRQNDRSFERTMAQVCELRPDRIAL